MELTVVIPYWNGGTSLRRLLDSLPVEMPVIVVDDQSDEPLVDMVERPVWRHYGGRPITIVRLESRGYFSGAVNRGMGEAEGDILVLNQDLWMEGTEWLLRLEELASEYDMIGDGVMGHPAWPNGYVQGTFMYMSRRAIERVGPLNMRDYPLWGATAEWQARLCRAGMKAYPSEEFRAHFGHKDRPKGSRYGEAITEALAREPEERRRFIRTPPMVSVIVPCYNYGRYLKDCVRSLVGGKTSIGEEPGQTFQGFEIIIVDDASTDDSEEYGRGLADLWKGIRYYRLRENTGTPNVLNFGISRAYGEYVTIISADDMAEPWHLESLLRVCQANPHRVAYGDLRILGAEGRGKRYRLPRYNFDSLIHKNCMSAGIMYPKKAWEEVGGYSPLMVHGREDWAMNIALGIKGYCGIHVGGKPGYIIRRQKQNRSLRTATRDWYGYFRSQLISLYPKIYGGDRPMGCCGRGSTKTEGRRPTGGSIAMRTAVTNPGARGMSLIEDTNPSAVPRPIWGPVTGTRYYIGGRRNPILVDNRDLQTDNSRQPGFLEIWEGGRRKYVLASPANLGSPPPKKEVSEAPTVEAVEAIALEEEEVESMADTDVFVADPGDMTIKELKEYLQGDQPLGATELSVMLALEESGKSRQYARKAIQEALDSV